MMLGVFDGYMPPSQDALTSSTKLGGTPNFLKTSPAIDGHIDELRWCKLCGDAMFLICQCFCPLTTAEEERTGNYIPENRMMYVFGCNSSRCNNANGDRSVVCFTLQVNEEDTSALADESDAPPPLPQCPSQSELPPSTFPPAFLDVVEEPLEEETVTDPTDLERELIAMAEKNVAAGDIPDEDIKQLEDAVDLKDKPADEQFEEFRSRINRLPTQVVRYERGGEPLYMCPDYAAKRVGPLKGALPPCAVCGGERAMELQVMPTALYFLHATKFVAPNKKKSDDGMDFGTITVFTCAAGCSHGVAGALLRQEFVLVEPPPSEKADRENETRPTFRQFLSPEAPEGGKATALKKARNPLRVEGEDSSSAGEESS